MSHTAAEYKLPERPQLWRQSQRDTPIYPVDDVNAYVAKAETRIAELYGALADMWAEATGDMKAKSCRHEATCICVGDKVRAALAGGGK